MYANQHRLLLYRYPVELITVHSIAIAGTRKHTLAYHPALPGVGSYRQYRDYCLYIHMWYSSR